MNIVDDLKKKKAIIGFDVIAKKIKKGEVKKVYVSSNFKNKADILNLGKNFSVDVEVVSENSKQLGVVCKKPFNVSVIGF